MMELIMELIMGPAGRQPVITSRNQDCDPWSST
jgi:hypothetical protein